MLAHTGRQPLDAVVGGERFSRRREEESARLPYMYVSMCGLGLELGNDAWLGAP